MSRHSHILIFQFCFSLPGVVGSSWGARHRITCCAFESSEHDSKAPKFTTRPNHMTIDNKELHSPTDPAAWTTGLCDCCGTPGGLQLCCTTCCCTCWQFGLNAERFEPDEVVCGGSKYGACMAYVGGIVAIHALDYMAGVDLLGLSALGVNATFLLAMLPALLMQCQMRNKIRHKYGIKGHALLDCLTVWCCQPCALCQEARELSWRTERR